MPTDLNGTPTSLGIGTYNVDSDAPSGLGFNTAMGQIDALIAARVAAPSGIASGEVPVWNGSTWVRSSATRVGPSSLGSGTPDATKYLRGDGAWVNPSLASVSLTLSAAQSIANNAQTAVAFNVVEWDSNSFYDSVNNRPKIPTGLDGLYAVQVWIPWAPNAALSRRFVDIWKNSTTVVARSEIPNPSGAFSPEVNHIISALDKGVGGDYYQALVYQNTGGSLNVQMASSTGVRPRIQLVRLGS